MRMQIKHMVNQKINIKMIIMVNQIHLTILLLIDKYIYYIFCYLKLYFFELFVGFSIYREVLW